MLSKCIVGLFCGTHIKHGGKFFPLKQSHNALSQPSRPGLWRNLKIANKYGQEGHRTGSGRSHTSSIVRERYLTNGYTRRLHPEVHHIEYPLGGCSVNCVIRRKKCHEEFLHPSLSRMQNFCIFRMFWSYSNGFLLQLLGLLIKITLLK